MASVKCLELGGIKMWFPSNDHGPPHFHAKRRGEWEYRVYFMLPEESMLEVKWENRSMSASDRKSLTELTAISRLKLLSEFDAVHANG